MPKVIENIRETVLQTAKKTLLSDGYDRLCLRKVSEQCNIAVGTIYNYFPSKLTLVTTIMLEDWTDHKEMMQDACLNAEDAEAGIKSIFFNLHEFAMIYQDVWNLLLNTKEVRNERMNGKRRRQELIVQLINLIRTLFDRFEISYDSFLPHFIATSLLTYIMEPDFDYEQINRIFKRMFI